MGIRVAFTQLSPQEGAPGPQGLCHPPEQSVWHVWNPCCHRKQLQPHPTAGAENGGASPPALSGSCISAPAVCRSIPSIQQSSAFIQGAGHPQGWRSSNKIQAVTLASGPQGDPEQAGRYWVSGKRMGHGTSAARGKDGEKPQSTSCAIRGN